jgi:hypothetical protein
MGYVMRTLGVAFAVWLSIIATGSCGAQASPTQRAGSKPVKPTTVQGTDTLGYMFRDVPFDHWAFKDLESLKPTGLVPAYSTEHHGRRRTLTRYEFAVIVDRLLKSLPLPTAGIRSDCTGDTTRQVAGPTPLTIEHVKALWRLATELSGELSELGNNMQAIKRHLNSITRVVKGGPFSEISTNHWAYEAVESLQEQGIVQGYPERLYRGERSVTRAEFAIALDRALSLSPSTSTGPNGLESRSKK